MNIHNVVGKKPIKMWTGQMEVEAEAISQLENLASLPFIHSHVAVMPDVHYGLGATVGSVIATDKVIIPAAVGVDIGCGMMAVKLNIQASDLPDNLGPLRSALEALIPHGRTDNGGPNDRGAFGFPGDATSHLFATIGYTEFATWIHEKHPKLDRAWRKAPHHLGTLGTGNHFVEICVDTEQGVWIMLHSGSRGIGNALGSYFIDRAKEEMARWHIHLVDKDLAYLPEGSQYYKDYLLAVSWAQDFARMNRQTMMDAALKAVSTTLGRPIVTEDLAINCHHNYVTQERHFGSNVWVTRKGAVNAAEGKMGIIPGSMGAKSFIVRGKGNRESFCSCSHGAGRKMSRNKAKELFTLEDHALATQGVECRKDLGVIDETPAAYKDIDLVMEAQSDLVEIVHTLKQLVCVKG